MSTTTELVYVNQTEAVLVNTNNEFVYEVSVFCQYYRYYSLIDRKFYSSKQAINGVIPYFKRDEHTKIVCLLYSAPISWLLENGYTKYVKPEKIIKTKPIKNAKSKTSIGKSRSWTAPGETASS